MPRPSLPLSPPLDLPKISIDCFEVLAPTPEEDEELYMQSIGTAASKRVHAKNGHMQEGDERPHDDDSIGNPTRERIVRQRTSTWGTHQTAPYSAWGTHQTAPITDFGTLFTHLCEYIDLACDGMIQQLRRYVDDALGHSGRIATAPWDFRDINDFMHDSAHHGSILMEPQSNGASSPLEQTHSIPNVGRASIPIKIHVYGASAPIEQTEGISTTGEASIPIEHTQSLDPYADRASIPIVTPSPSVVPDEMLVTPPEVARRLVHLLHYTSYFPFSAIMVWKRKDIDEEPYMRWLASSERLHVRIRWLNYNRKGALMVDDEDTDFLISHVHGLRPFGGGIIALGVLTIWNTSRESTSGYWVVLRIRLKEGITIMYDSLDQGHNTLVKLRSQHSSEDESTTCVAFYRRTLESLVK
ncbi:hypothetical protein OROHE_007388 [Orobanche hederae]